VSAAVARHRGPGRALSDVVAAPGTVDLRILI
jgi:hypothetical protein